MTPVVYINQSKNQIINGNVNYWIVHKQDKLEPKDEYFCNIWRAVAVKKLITATDGSLD